MITAIPSSQLHIQHPLSELHQRPSKQMETASTWHLSKDEEGGRDGEVSEPTTSARGIANQTTKTELEIKQRPKKCSSGPYAHTRSTTSTKPQRLANSGKGGEGGDLCCGLCLGQPRLEAISVAAGLPGRRLRGRRLCGARLQLPLGLTELRCTAFAARGGVRRGALRRLELALCVAGEVRGGGRRTLCMLCELRHLLGVGDRGGRCLLCTVCPSPEALRFFLYRRARRVERGVRGAAVAMT